jgi:PadR family transcriptional regulator, regulatory protein AphA
MIAPRTNDPRDLPATCWAILGMLTFGPISGYDLGKQVDKTIGHFFSPARSQIYSELRRLVNLGYSTATLIPQTDRPNKRIYEITQQGREHLKWWLETSAVEPEAVRSSFLLKLFFGGLMDEQAVLNQVRKARQIAEDELRVLEELQEELKANPDLFFPTLAIRYGLAHNAASLKWTGEVLQDLDRRVAGGTG